MTRDQAIKALRAIELAANSYDHPFQPDEDPAESQQDDDRPIYGSIDLTLGDLRKARAVLLYLRNGGSIQ